MSNYKKNNNDIDKSTKVMLQVIDNYMEKRKGIKDYTAIGENIKENLTNIEKAFCKHQEPSVMVLKDEIEDDWYSLIENFKKLLGEDYDS